MNLFRKLDPNQSGRHGLGRTFGCMANLIFKCPRTGMNVQHWLEESRTGDPGSYESVVCKACTRLHFINRRTRKLLGDQE